MVAITVILAAVIGGFVLNLGGNLEQTPQAQISIEAGSDTGDIDISHNGGDAIPVSDLTVNVDGSDTTTDFTDDVSDEFTVGDSATLTSQGSSQVTVTIIHNPSDTILAETDVTPPA